MISVPAVTCTLGSQLYERHAAGLHVALGVLPAVGTCTIVLPRTVPVEASAGDTASLQLDSGDGPQAVLRGAVRTLRRRLDGTVAVLADAGAALSSLRPAQTLRSLAVGEIVTLLASDAGVVAAEVNAALDLPAYVAHQARTAAEHIAALAALAGAVATVDADGLLHVAPPPERPDVALRHGREILDYQVDVAPAAEARQVRVGSGPAGAAAAPDALRPSADPLPADAPAPGRGAVRLPTPVLRTPRAATAASKAADRVAAARTLRLHARCTCLPAVRPGQVLQVQDLPDGQPRGPWLLTRVVHRIEPRAGAWTELYAQAIPGASDGLAAALPAINPSIPGGLP